MQILTRHLEEPKPLDLILSFDRDCKFVLLQAVPAFAVQSALKEIAQKLPQVQSEDELKEVIFYRKRRIQDHLEDLKNLKRALAPGVALSTEDENVRRLISGVIRHMVEIELVLNGVSLLFENEKERPIQEKILALKGDLKRWNAFGQVVSLLAGAGLGYWTMPDSFWNPNLGDALRNLGWIGIFYYGSIFGMDSIVQNLRAVSMAKIELDRLKNLTDPKEVRKKIHQLYFAPKGPSYGSGIPFSTAVLLSLREAVRVGSTKDLLAIAYCDGVLRGPQRQGHAE